MNTLFPIEPYIEEPKEPQRFIITDINHKNQRIFVWKTHDNGIEWCLWSKRGRKKPRLWNSVKTAQRVITNRLGGSGTVEPWDGG